MTEKFLITQEELSHEIGKENAEQEYLKFKENKQKNISEGDFEKAIKKIENKKRK